MVINGLAIPMSVYMTMSHEGHHGSSEIKMSQTFFGSNLQLISDSALNMAFSENELYGG